MRPEKKDYKKLLELALEEDIKIGDVTTSAIVGDDVRGTGVLIAKESGIICGLDVFIDVYRSLSASMEFEPLVEEGAEVKKNEEIMIIRGRLDVILTGERTALNFLQRMSGVATAAAKYVKEAEPFGCKILDTRKTVPGFRYLDKYAVRTGRAHNHRFGLYDMVLIKENHIKQTGSITEAVKSIRRAYGDEYRIEVETATLKEIEEAAGLGVDIIMFDNMNIADIKKGGKIVDRRALIEVSGNIKLKDIKKFARCNVDFISTGAITHSVEALDISLLIK